MPVRRAISAGEMPASPCAWSTRSTDSRRASRSRLPSIREPSSGGSSYRSGSVRSSRSSRSVIGGLPFGPASRRWQDGDRQPPVDGGEAEADERVQGVRVEGPRGTGQPAVDLPELAVGEDPVVEIAAPAVQVRAADEQVDLWERPAEGAPVQRDPAVPAAGSLDEREPVVLGDGAIGRGEGLECERAVEVTVGHLADRRRLPWPPRREHPRAAADARRAL